MRRWLMRIACGAAALLVLVQLGLVQTALDSAQRERAALRTGLSEAVRRLEAARATAASLAERAKAESSQAARPALTTEEQLVESLRTKLGELLRRHAGEARPPPLTNPFKSSPAPMTDAEYVRWYRIWYQSRVELEYNELLAARPLPPETKLRLSELLLERQLARMDTLDVTGAARWSPSNLPTREQSAAVDRAQAKVDGQFDAEIRALLGEEEFAEFAAFAASSGVRRDINVLAERLSYSTEPLLPAQRAQLLALLRHESIGGLGLWGAVAPDRGQSIVADLARFLTSRQIATLQQLYSERYAPRK